MLGGAMKTTIDFPSPPLLNSFPGFQDIASVARECQKTWGMGFPVISLPLLRPCIEGLIRDAFARGLEAGAEYVLHRILEREPQNT